MESIRRQLLVTLVATAVAAGFLGYRAPPPGMSLDVAVRFNDMGQFRRNLRWHVRTNAPDCFFMTPLHWAAVVDHRQMAGLLISHGADVEARTLSVRQSIQMALGEEAKVFAGWGVEDTDGGETPLHCAAEHGSMAVARLLITKGADVNAVARSGRRPLAFAIEEGHHDLADLLRRHGARE